MRSLKADDEEMEGEESDSHNGDEVPYDEDSQDE